MSSGPPRTGMVSGLKQDLTLPLGQDLPCHQQGEPLLSLRTFVWPLSGIHLVLNFPCFVWDLQVFSSCLLVWAPDRFSQ